MSDSFLPSGAVDPHFAARHSSLISPMSHTPRAVPPTDFIPSPHASRHSSPAAPTNRFSSPTYPPISPPKTRPVSAEESAAAMIENFRGYTARLRCQAEGERAHMAADRARMQEVMNEERGLWDQEREWLKGKIAELEKLVEKRGSGGKALSPQGSSHHHRPANYHRVSSLSSNSGSVDSAAHAVPQESGRNADGSPFYAPAPRKPSRTFDISSRSEMRVDSIIAPRETPICVTRKELTPSDFVQTSPKAHAQDHLDTIQETPAETIDIQLIQPELEGVSIKASAVLPSFAAKVLSPKRSPKISPELKAPGRDVTNIERRPSGKISPEEKAKMTRDVVSQPENRRLTMYAGHTPSHSTTDFGLFKADDSGNATPTQEHHKPEPKDEHAHHPSYHDKNTEHLLSVPEETDDGDKELTGPLSLKSSGGDDIFLDQLNKKLLEEVARRSRDVSPSTASQKSSERSRSPLEIRKRKSVERAEDEDEEEAEDEAPKLKLKPSMNFGRPLGSF